MTIDHSLKPGTHRHRCECGRSWVHANSSYGDMEAHRCVCGRYVAKKSEVGATPIQALLMSLLNA